MVHRTDSSPGTYHAIYVLRDPEPTDFTFQKVTGIVKTAVDGSTTVVLQEVIPAIVPGMIVTSNEKLVNQPVTVTAVNEATITLSSQQTGIPAKSELVFSPPDDWAFEVTNVSVTGSNILTDVGDISPAGSDLCAEPPTPLYGNVVVTADYEIEKYGNLDLTSVLKTNRFLTFWDTSGINTSALVQIKLGSGGSNVSGYGVMTGRHVAVGTTENTTLYGTIVIKGNWSNNVASDITVGLNASGCQGFHTSSYSGDTVLTTEQFPGTGTGNDQATINWAVDVGSGGVNAVNQPMILDFAVTLAE